MKTTIRISLGFFICWQFVCCAGMPVNFNAGISGKTEDGNDWHAGISTPIVYGAKQPLNVQPSGK